MNASDWSRIGTVWIGGGLVCNFTWEMLQMPLYGKFEGGWWRCFEASLGDVVLLAVLYGLMACAAERWTWFERLSSLRVVLLAVLGLLVAVVVELWALAEGRWVYGAAMPRLPMLGVGWAPVLQMTVIPLGLAWLSRSWDMRTGPGRPARGGGRDAERLGREPRDWRPVARRRK